MKTVNRFLFIMLVFLTIGTFCQAKKDEDKSSTKRVSYIEDIRQNYTSLYIAIQEVKEDNYELYKDIMRELGRQWRSFKELEKTNPRLIQIEVGVKELEIRNITLRKHFHAEQDAVKKKTIRDKIKTNVNEMFDLKAEKRKLEIAVLENEINKLNTELKNMNNRKKEIVEQRVQEITVGDIFNW